MSKKPARSRSKFLSKVLRHAPESIGIELDEHGWVEVEGLLAAAGRHGVRIERDELFALVASSDKQRFALSEDRTKIRANQGHTVEVDLQLTAATPPEHLYHGTVAPAIAGIRAKGLMRGERHHVHLSPDVETARKVGARRGKPIILTIRAAAMAAAGHAFYRSDNGVWLVDAVPAAFVEIPADVPASDRTNDITRGAKAGIAKQTLAACEAGAYTNPDGEVVALRQAIDAARDGTRLHQLDRIRIAEHTLGAIDAGFYVNGRHEVVPIATTAERAIAATTLHDGGDVLDVRRRFDRTAIEVTGETTSEAIVRLAARAGGHLACLNFASAKNPGGGFLGGAQAQEEALARSSALYPCLLGQRAHYDANRANASPLYLDLAIWSPHVPFFRDDRGGWLPRPALASVVTCAAPNASALRQQGKLDLAVVEATLRRRARLVLAVAAHHGVERFILGAWGAGVFGNDPAVVASAFGDLLEGDFAGAFAEVTFAILPRPAGNLDAFAKRFDHSRDRA